MKMVIVRTILSIAASRQWPMYQMDVSNVFLQGDLHDEVYMEIPQGFSDGVKGHRYQVCKLLKFLYVCIEASFKVMERVGKKNNETLN